MFVSPLSVSSVLLHFVYHVPMMRSSKLGVNT
jgi:hypothetical protein